MPKQKLTRDRLRQIIREEKAKLQESNQERMLQGNLNSMENLIRRGPNDIVDAAARDLSEDELRELNDALSTALHLLGY